MSPIDDSKPRKGLRKFLKEKLRGLRPRLPSLTKSLPQSDRSASSSHAGPDKISGSTSVANSVTPSVDLPPATNEATSHPESNGDVTSTPVIIVPPDTESGIMEQPAIHEGPSPQTDVSGQEEIPNHDTSRDDPELERQDLLWAGLRTSLEMLKDAPTMLPGFVSPIETLLSSLDGLRSMGRDRSDFEDLTERLTALSEWLRQNEDPLSSIPKSDAFASVMMSIEFEALAIKTTLDRGETESLERVNIGEEVARRYRRIESLFRSVQDCMNTSAWNVLIEDIVNLRLDRLDPVKEATYDSSLSVEVNRRSCTEGTRTGVLTELDEWLENPDSPSVHWINGMPGAGKTTIAYTFCERARKRKLLAASFFCVRNSEDCKDVNRIVPTIADQFAQYSIPLRSAMCDALAFNPEAASRNIRKQFDQLLVEPIQRVKDALPGRLVVVIDALDECDNLITVEILLDLIFQYASSLPIKFLITSRPETEIYIKMSTYAQSRGGTHLHDIDSSVVQADIKLYMTRELQLLSPTEAEIDQLAERAGLSFIHAASLVQRARSDERSVDPPGRPRAITDMTSEEQQRLIDPVYMKVIETALNDDELEDDEIEDIRVVLDAVLLAQEPINYETIGMLAGIDYLRRVENGLFPLRSVLRHSERTGLVSTLDSTFPKMMFSKERSGDYFCDPGERSELPAQGCFLGMKEQLRFNICELETSFLPDDKVEDIQSRIRDKISPTLAYACRYWVNHFSLVANIDSVLPMFIEFLSERLLFWMEVLNLRRELDIGVAALRKAKERLQKWLKEPGSVIDPRNTPAPTFLTWKIGSGMLSAAYSPNDAWVATGCEDGTVSIWDTRDGSRLVGPLEAHKGWVRCVVFSPDGANILSASSDEDGVIRMWDALEGKPIKVFKGHTHPVKSIAFSQDGTRIVSGSWDNTVRIWNVTDCTLAMEPLEGHKWGVNCVAFSPDSKLAASGGNDHAIQLWDLASDAPVSKEFQGHTNAVMSIVFTPDGTRLVSGSVDGTIRIWNIDGALVNTFLQGCTHSIYSVAVSPDGTYVASGSADSAIRVWNIDDGKLIAGPFMAHSSGIRSVVFSPDGARVLSRFHRDSIRVWELSPQRQPLGSGISGWWLNRPGAPIEPEYFTRRIRDFHQEKQSYPPHCLAPATVASFAWLLDGSDIAYLNDDPTLPDIIHTPDSSDTLAYVPEGCTWRSDGWLVNKDSHLMIWVPPSSTSCHLSSDTIGNAKLLFSFSRDKRFIGNRWPGNNKTEPV
ncbi:hypothetical protein FRC11_006340 [Ceratobasidium sp. 423]|nr:hypothetical protein FRC11_006340 [Ceratobasidium sp. 423]